MRLSPTPTLSKITLKIDRSIKVQTSIRVDINIQSLEVSRCINQPNFTSLNKVIRNNDVFLIRRHFNVVGTDGGLDFIGVVETLDVVEVRNVEGGDVVCRCEG
jgi:hypothetical protein